ncbi:hypothetical protein Aperf_G00000114092 [Anoplocephala perfoliata]
MDQDIEGFIQFRSPDFMVDASITVMVKLTSELNCLCGNSVYNIIIAWKPDDKNTQSHRENFLRSIDELMHRRPNETKVWCYKPNESYVDLVSRSSHTSGHVCPKWPHNLLPSVNVKIARSFRNYYLVDCYDDTDCKGPSERAIISPALLNLSVGTEIQVYGLWSFEGRFLRLGILSSWRGKSGAIPVLHSKARLDASSVSEDFLRLSLMDSLLPLTDDSLDDDSLEKAGSIAKFILANSYSELESLSLSSFRLAKEFVHVHKFTPSPQFGYKVLTTRDLSNEDCAFFQPTTNSINVLCIDLMALLLFSFLSGLQFFESVDHHQELILIGRLGRNVKTGGLIIKHPFPTSVQAPELPLVFTNLTRAILTGNLLDEMVMIRQPRLVTMAGSDGSTQNFVRAFGRCISSLPKICILCDFTPKRLLLVEDSSFPPEEGQEDDVFGPILLRYVSSLSSSGTDFSIRYEKGFEDSNELQAANLRSPSNLWAFSCGLFTVGRRIHLECRPFSGEGKSSNVIPTPIMEPQDASVSASCHHLVGLYNFRIFGVQEVLGLLNEQKKDMWISLQGYIFKHDAPSRRMGQNRWRVSVWLIDAYRNDPTASSPLRIDFHVNENDNKAVEELARLPLLTHLCFFKAHLMDSRLFLPLSPNRLQISPNSLASYLAAHDIPDGCSCFSDKPVDPECKVCTPQETPQESRELALPEPRLPRMDLLSDEKYPKTCLVHIIRCLNFKVFLLEKEDCVRVMLKIIVSDGSATATGNFDSEMKTSCSSPALCWLATLLGLEESVTRQVVSHVSRINEESEDPVGVGLNAWLASPGFLRPVWLTFEIDSNNGMTSCWRLNTMHIDREVRLVVPPLQNLRMII